LSVRFHEAVARKEFFPDLLKSKASRPSLSHDMTRIRLKKLMVFGENQCYLSYLQ
jgi:hypothetical protein